jgi:hypothetical protein
MIGMMVYRLFPCPLFLRPSKTLNSDAILPTPPQTRIVIDADPVLINMPWVICSRVAAEAAMESRMQTYFTYILYIRTYRHYRYDVNAHLCIETD